MNQIKVVPTSRPFLKFGKKRAGFYKGMKMKTDEGVHEQLCDFLFKAGVDIDNKYILDWGCGTGALSQRLVDMGADVMSIDIDRDNFNANSKFKCVDFNDRESYLSFIEEHHSLFDVVIASEVIEHVENPWEFVRSIMMVLKDDGVALVSTPNTSSVLSRLNFLLTGNVFSFEKKDLTYGHITPISFLKMSIISKDVGMKITHWAAGGSLPLVWLGLNPKYLIYSLFSLMGRWVMRGQKNGWCLMFIVKKDI